MFSIESKIFKEKLIEVINNCDLPVSLAYYIVKDVYNELNFLYTQAIQNKQNNNGRGEEILTIDQNLLEQKNILNNQEEKE